MEIKIAKKVDGKWKKVGRHLNCDMGWVNYFAAEYGFTEEDVKQALEDGKVHRGKLESNRHLWLGVRMQTQYLVQANSGQGWYTCGSRDTQEAAEDLAECRFGGISKTVRVYKWVH